MKKVSALSVRSVDKVYRSGLHAVRGVSLEVEQGDFFALLGPNGAGKTSLIGVITALVQKTRGRVSVFGHDIDRSLNQAKACIGLVPQEFNFNIFKTVHGILIDNAGYYGIPRSVALPRAERLLKQLDLWGKRDAPARTLSGGMKRRLMIARAMITDPRLLILDEPTAGVDVEMRRATWSFLEAINATGVTIILTTHYLEEAEHLCKTIAIMRKGVLMEHTRMEQLLRKLKHEVVVLYLQSSVETVPTVPGFSVRGVDAQTLEVDISSDQTLTDLLRALSEQGVDVLRVQSKVHRLEALFLDVTQGDVDA